MRQAVRAFLDSYKDIEKDKLNNDLERISKVINELKKVEGLEPEVPSQANSGDKATDSPVGRVSSSVSGVPRREGPDGHRLH
jgi:hypothetical protein